MPADKVRGNGDVLFICETKIEQTFPSHLSIHDME